MYDHLRVIEDSTTESLIERYRRWPTADVQHALERRGVELWHYGLARVADPQCSVCGGPVADVPATDSAADVVCSGCGFDRMRVLEISAT